MLLASVGLTAIEVSLCGPTDDVSQSVLTLGVSCVAVVQIAVPVFTAGAVPYTAPETGAGASFTLWVKSMGCVLSPPSPAATAQDWLSPTTERVRRITAPSRRSRDESDCLAQPVITRPDRAIVGVVAVVGRDPREQRRSPGEVRVQGREGYDVGRAAAAVKGERIVAGVVRKRAVEATAI